MKFPSSVFFILITTFFVLTLHSAYELTDHDIKARSLLESSIRSRGFFDQSIASLSSWIPSFLKNGALTLSKPAFTTFMSNSYIRRAYERQVFSTENGQFAEYDAITKHFVIPEDPVDISILLNLLKAAEKEREGWEKGQMSGAVYDGSTAHMQMLAQAFRLAIESDPKLALLLQKDPTAKELAVQIFQNCHTANPLHGTSFLLSVKAMRELASMFASLVGRSDGIVSSGGREALRVGIKAIKNHHREILLIDDNLGSSLPVLESLNLNPIKAKSDSLFEVDIYATPALFMLSMDNIQYLRNVVDMAGYKKWQLHVHLDYQTFLKLLSGELSHHGLGLDLGFSAFSSLTSVSFETGRLVYNGLSATVFRDKNARYNAFESHVDWMGGMYPGLNAQGSMAGGDMITAYFLMLHHGKKGLRTLALQEASHPDQLQDEGMANNYVDDFSRIVNNILGSTEEPFTLYPTSGGTESIRIALQTYANVVRRNIPCAVPLFFLAESAHIAFIRHIKDIDGQIVWVRQNAYGSMDEKDLEAKILQHRNDNIAAIIGSLPSYPLGTYDDIKILSKLASKYQIPFHVDACLGGFVVQFLESELKLELGNPDYMGVTSVSIDSHKYGLTPKGLSSVLFRNQSIEPKYHHENIAEKRSFTQLCVGLHCLTNIGIHGYQEKAQAIVTLGDHLMRLLGTIDGIELITDPTDELPHFVVAFRLQPPWTKYTYSFASFMKKLGWQLSQVGDYTLHIALTNAHTYHEQFLGKFISDTQFVIDLIKKTPNLSQSASVGVYGMAAGLDIKGLDRTHPLTETFLRACLGLYAENLLSVD